MKTERDIYLIDCKNIPQKSKIWKIMQVKIHNDYDGTGWLVGFMTCQPLLGYFILKSV